MGADSERLAAIQKRLDAASEAPWEVHIEGGIDPNGEGWSAVEINFNTSDRAGPGLMMGSYEGDQDDAEFIAHARDDIPWLLSRLRAVESERDMLLALVDDACASDDLTVLRDWQTSRLLKETQQ